MPFILIVVGIILLVTAIQGTTGQLASMLSQDVFGAGGYLYWFVAILVIGAVGYVKQLKTLSDMGIFLVVLVLILSHKGLFQQFNAELKKIKSSGFGASATSAPGTGVAAPVGSSLADAARQIQQGVPQVVVPNAEQIYGSPGLEIQPIPGL